MQGFNILSKKYFSHPTSIFLLFFFFFLRILTSVLLGEEIFQGLTFCTSFNCKIQIVVYVFMKMEIKAASAFYFINLAKGIRQQSFQLDLSFKLLVK